MSEKKAKSAGAEQETLTYRVRPTGDGRYYTWAKYDGEGNEVEVAPMSWPSEADAEKAARSVVSGNDVIAVTAVHSVDREDNNHVVLEKPVENAADENFGMAVKYVESKAQTEGDNTRSVDLNYTPAMKAVDAGTVAPAASDSQPTDAELAARAKAQAKADKEAEKNA